MASVQLSVKVVVSTLMPAGTVGHIMVYTVLQTVVCVVVGAASSGLPPPGLPPTGIGLALMLSHSPHGSVLVTMPVSVIVSPAAFVELQIVVV